MKTILLANNDVSVRVAQKDILTKFGYEIVGETDTVKQTVKEFEELMPDLAIVGFNPYAFDGILAIKEMRNIDNKAMFVVSSDFSAHSAVIEAIQIGVMDWVSATLPLNQEQLLRAVRGIGVSEDSSLSHS